MMRILLVVCFVICSIPAYAASKATVDCDVVDEDGIAIAGALVEIAFEVNGRSGNQVIEGYTDSKGHLQATGETTGHVTCSAFKNGYYDSIGLVCAFPRDWRILGGALHARCEVVLKRVIKPVPMYVRDVSLAIPAMETELGFDLKAGDWVAPYGIGQESDFIIYAKCRWESLKDFESLVRLTFRNTQDGIQVFTGDSQRGSVLTSPHCAPLGGFEPVWSRVVSASPNRGRSGWDLNPNNHLIFRVRSIEDREGNLISANYGKIYGNIITGGEASGRMRILFRYYYNPEANERSIEFDPKHNLAGVEGQAERVKP